MAINAATHWEFRPANGVSTNGGGFAWKSLVNSTYRWTASGSGTNEFYCELAAGGDPSLPGQSGMSVTTDGKFNEDTEGAAGSLNAGEWDWADNDTLGFSTVYVRLDDGVDPDAKNIDFVQMGLTGGKDYSQQNAAQLTLTDGATSGIGVTTFTSATGGFTALMIDNMIQITSGTNVNAGWRQIVGFTDTNTITLDAAPDDGVGGASGVNFKVGGALDILTDNFFDNANAPGPIAGNPIHVQDDGTMTLTGSIVTPLDGNVDAWIKMRGYNTTRGDNPEAANRPLIAAGANSFSFDNYWWFANFRFTTTAATGWDGTNDNIWENIHSNNSSGTARTAITPSQNNRVYGCEAQSANGIGINAFNTLIVKGSYIHDCGVSGIDVDQATNFIVGNVLDTCEIGFETHATANSPSIFFTNNTVYNCPVGFNGNGNARLTILNDIFDANGTAIDFDAFEVNNFLDYNVYDNTVDIVNAIKGPHSVTGDPGMTDPANGDFTLGGGSNAVDAGLDASIAGATV